MKPFAAMAVFLFHMALAMYLITLPSTPVKVDVPGLERCEPNQYGGYDEGCMTRNSIKIAAYTQTNQAPPDFRRRDGAAIGLAFLVGLSMRLLLGTNWIGIAIVSVAYSLPVLLGIILLPAASVFIFGFLAMHGISIFLSRRNQAG